MQDATQKLTRDELVRDFLAAHPAGNREEFESWVSTRAGSGVIGELRAEVLERLDELLRSGASVEAERGRTIFGRQGLIDAAEVAPSIASPTVDQRIGVYVLRRFIASGGMGQVWEAEDTVLRRRVALKLVLPGRFDERSLERFAREARAGGRLAHENLVRTLGYGVDDGHSWIAQELVEGSWTLKDSLARLRASERLPAGYYRYVTEFVARVADGLHVAHEAGVVHRDVKPQNILIASDDSPRVTDFGLARVREDSDLSRSGDLAGTWAYMSPEQLAASRRQLDHRTDVFSLGIVLYEMLTLRRPFDGDTSQQVARQILLHDPALAHRVRSQCPRELAIICSKALEKAPGARYATMAEFAADLRRHLANEPLHARPIGPVSRGVKWVRRHPALATTAGVVVIALLVVSSLLQKNVRINQDLEARNLELRSQTRIADERAADAAKQAELARTSAVEAAAQATLAELRADELQQVAQFQARQLQDLDVHGMGVTLRSLLRERLRVPAPDAAELATLHAEFDEIALHTDFTGAVLQMFSEHVFDSTERAIQTHFTDQPVVSASLLHSLGGTLFSAGLLDDAVLPLARAVELRRTELGQDDRATSESLLLLGRLQVRRGEHEQAESLLLTVGDSLREQPDADVAIRSEALQYLGELRFEQQRFDEAQSLFEEALVLRTDAFGSDDERVLTTSSSLALVRYHARDFEAAESMAEAHLEGYRRVLGATHPNTLNALEFLAMVLKQRGRWEEAEARHREALAGRRARLGDDHPHTLNSLHNLAELLRSRGRLPEAESMLREVYEERRRTLGANHRNTLTSLTNLASTHLGMGRFEEAEAELSLAVSGLSTTLGPDYPGALVARNSHAQVLVRLGRLDEAESMFRGNLEYSRASLSASHSLVLTFTSALGGHLARGGRFEEAEPLLRESVEGLRANLGSKHRDTLGALNALTQLYWQQERYEEAEGILREIVAARAEALGRDNPVSLATMHNLATVLVKRGEIEEPIALYEEVLEGRLRVLGEQHDDTALTSWELGGLLYRQTRFEEALAHLQVAYDHARVRGGESSPLAIDRLPGVVRTLVALERFAEAEPLALESERLCRESRGAEDPSTVGAVEQLASLYRTWEIVEPDPARLAQATRWAARLEEVNVVPAAAPVEAR